MILQDAYEKLILFDCEIKNEGEITYILSSMGFYDIGLGERRELFTLDKKSVGYFLLPKEISKARGYGSVYNLLLRKHE